MPYKVVKFHVKADVQEILMAHLMNIGFEAFEENDDNLCAYVEDSAFEEQMLVNLLSESFTNQSVTYEIEDLEDKNWNEEWERNFDPVVVDGQVMIRASFHPPNPNIKYDLLIHPQMSFGTGHHETTYLMVRQMLKMDWQGKAVLDVGTGTGILAIMACKLGADYLLTTDVDQWSISNCRENFNLNHCQDIEVLQGRLVNIKPPQTFDVVLANINKNVLMEEIPHYATAMQAQSFLLLSGFYVDDERDIETCCAHQGLTLHAEDYKNDWACLCFEKG